LGQPPYIPADRLRDGEEEEEEEEAISPEFLQEDTQMSASDKHDGGSTTIETRSSRHLLADRAK
jgi:hypothetical protein